LSMGLTIIDIPAPITTPVAIPFIKLAALVIFNLTFPVYSFFNIIFIILKFNLLFFVNMPIDLLRGIEYNIKVISQKEDNHMPIKISNELPAAKTLEKENIFVMTEKRAMHQDIRPLKIAILNLMPTKIVTETQLLRLIGNTPLQVDVDLIKMSSHESKNTSQEHLLSFYKTFDEIKDTKYDGMIITGAPVEKMEFEEVDYWDELCQIMDWTTTHVTSTFHICWGAQAGLYYHYGINKKPLEKKLTGIFKHKVTNKKKMLLRGFDDEFYAPHSRYTTVDEEDIKQCKDLEILATSDEAGVYIVTSKKGKRIFVTGHSEYDANTLNEEYIRDLGKGITDTMPQNYYPNNDPKKKPVMLWRGHANMLYTNWLNYHVYQATPYDINSIK